MQIQKFVKQITIKSKKYNFFDINALQKKGIADVARLPFTIKILVENLLRKLDGRIVKEEDLVSALRQKLIGGAGLDVYEEESGYFFEDRSNQVITDDVLARLLTFPNVLITSHQAFLTEDALRNIAETTARNIRAFLAGKREG